MQLDDSTLWRNNTKLVSRSCYISRIGHRIFSFQQTIRGGWWPDIERDKMEWNRMSPKRFDQFAICYCEAKFQYRIQSLQNVCNLCSTRSVLSLTSLRYRYVAVPTSRTCFTIRLRSRRESFFDKSCWGRVWRIVRAIFGDCIVTRTI